MKFWEMLAEKGKIATLIGFIFSVPCIIWLYYRLWWSNMPLTDIEKDIVIMIQIFSLIWFMLPSKISAKFGNGEFIIED